MTTHRNKPKTNGRMLPQSCPLESCLISATADKGKKKAGPVHCREEIPHHGTLPPQQCGETGQVTGSNTNPPGQGTVFVLSKRKSPLMPCHPARARMILKAGRAVVARLRPFVLRIRDRIAGSTQPIQLKIDPGAKHTGIALNTKKAILTLIELTHRKAIIQKKLAQRRAYRRRRRTANLRCRQPRFNNRRKSGFIAPSIRSIIGNVQSWIQRLRRWTPVTKIVIETTKFDAAKLQNPEITGVEYQQGTLHGFTVWEYLLQKFNHACVYCGKSKVPLTKDHVIPRAQGGSDRVNNLTLACLPCNQAKGSMAVNEFLSHKPQKLKALQAQLKKPLSSCATMNILRSQLGQVAIATGLPVETSSGAETKFNRSRFGIPKSHALDAAFTGTMDVCPKGASIPTLLITATGRGSHCRTKTDAYGFPRLKLPRTKMIHGFQTGDIVQTPKGTGRIAVRTNGHFSLNGSRSTVKHKQCRLLQRADGYNYRFLPTLTDGVSSAKN